jgi:hypothetical protein
MNERDYQEFSFSDHCEEQEEEEEEDDDEEEEEINGKDT